MDWTSRVTPSFSRRPEGRDMGGDVKPCYSPTLTIFSFAVTLNLGFSIRRHSGDRLPGAARLLEKCFPHLANFQSRPSLRPSRRIPDPRLFLFNPICPEIRSSLRPRRSAGCPPRERRHASPRPPCLAPCGDRWLSGGFLAAIAARQPCPARHQTIRKSGRIPPDLDATSRDSYLGHGIVGRTRRTVPRRRLPGSR